MSEQTQAHRATIAAEVPPNPEVIEVRKVVNDVAEKVNSIGSEIAAFREHVGVTRALLIVLESIGVWKCGSCKMNMNGICGGWRLPEDLSSSLKSVAGGDVVIQQDNVYRLRVDKFPFIGAVCPIHIHR